MTNTPTSRPPNRPRNGRRPPEGRHAVPLSPRDQQRRDNLTRAAQVLRSAGEKQLAEDVEFVLTPDGALFVNRMRKHSQRGDQQTYPDNMPIRIPEDRLKVIHDGQRKGANLTVTVEDGLRDWLTGKFVLRVEPRARRGSGGSTGILTVRPNQELQDTVNATCKRRRETGEERRVYPATVAAHALYAHFQIGPYAPDADQAE